MTPRKKSLELLTPLELEVMGVVWELGDCTSAQVTAAFRKRRQLAPSTIRTVLSTLCKKGYVEPVPAIGRGFTFRATIKRETAARTSLSALVASFFKGSPRQAIAYLLSDEDITESDLNELRREIEVLKKKGRKK